MEEKQKKEPEKKVQKVEAKEKFKMATGTDKKQDNKVNVKVKGESKKEKKKSGKKKSGFGKFIKAILLILLTVFVVYILYSFMKWNLVCKVYEANKDIDIGNNYKITTKNINEVETTSEKIYKDGVGILKAGNIKYMWLENKSSYIILEDNKAYLEINESSPVVQGNQKISVETYGILKNKQKPDFLREVVQRKIKISVQEFKGEKCYVIEDEKEKIFVDKDSKIIVRNEKGKEAREVKIEKNVVKNSDIRLPDLSKFIKLN